MTPARVSDSACQKSSGLRSMRERLRFGWNSGFGRRRSATNSRSVPWRRSGSGSTARRSAASAHSGIRHAGLCAEA